MTHICVSKITIIGSDNGLSPDRRQAIICTNAGLLVTGPLGTNFSEILIEILTFSFKKIRLNMSSAKRRPFCLGLNVLTICKLREGTISTPLALKRKCCHFDEILITDCTESCHFDNFRCSQWWKFRQNDDICVSVHEWIQLKLPVIILALIWCWICCNFTSLVSVVQPHIFYQSFRFDCKYDLYIEFIQVCN